MTRFFTATATLLLTLLVVPPVRAAIPHRYVEDFHTAQYKDAPNTTALWHTNLGELRLFKFVPRVVGSHDTPWYARDIWVSGDYAYVSDLNSGVQVFDISDPTAPDSVGTFPAATFASDVEIDGDYAYIADGTNGFRILDVSDPANPSQLSLIFPMPDYTRGVTVEGDYAFVAVAGFAPAMPSHLVVVDISDPERPSIAATRDLPDWAADVYVSGDYVYVATAPGGLNIFNIIDPANPVFLSNFPTGDYCRQVFVAGNFAYLAAGATGLRIVDVTNPLSPVEVGSYDTPDYAFGVILDGAYAYVADRRTGLMVFDVSDPTDPILVHTIDTPEKAIRCAYEGEYVYVADAQGGLQIIQVRENLPPLHVSTFATTGPAARVALNGRRAYVKLKGGPLVAIDITDPEAPAFLGASGSVPGGVGGLAVDGRMAFVTTSFGGEMLAFDITGPVPALFSLAFSTGGEPGRMVIHGDNAFVANGTPGMTVVDISNLPFLTAKDTLYPGNHTIAVDVAGNDAFLSFVGGLVVVDITDPSSTFIKGGISDLSAGSDVQAKGNTLYVADGLLIYDITNPSNPVPLGSIHIGLARALEVSGKIAYVAEGNLGVAATLKRIDVSDPANPTVIDSAITLNSLDLTLAGDYAYVADWTDGMKTFQVFQRWFNLRRTSARSIEIDQSNKTIVKASLLAAQTDSVSWEISADGGNQWQDILFDGTWSDVGVAGSDLRWRAQFTYVSHGNMPIVTDLSIDWLYEPAVIDSIIDVPNDRGGAVDIYLTRSGYDFADAVSTPITGYDIFRRPGSTGPVPASGVEWTLVGSIEAMDTSVYVTQVPTVADSADSVTWSVYYVSARTTDSLVFFDSAPDSGYSVDNLGPPNAVAFTRFEATYRDGRAVVSWEVGHARELEGFHVYRAVEGGAFTLLHADLLPATMAGEYIDETVARGRVYRYRLGAVDADGEFFSATATLRTPAAVFALYPNHPNPFNPTTTIPYSIANPGQATMRIYDVSGRVVRSLFDRYHDPGPATAVWDGRDDDGRPAASGVYFFKLDSGRFTQIRKLVLLK